jgi:hypothetical protein
LEIESMAEALRVEPDGDVARLIALGVAAADHDPKLSAIVLEIRLIRLSHRRANILIYTEYTDSQVAAARALLAAHGIDGEILTIGGHDGDQARAAAAQQFAERDGLILISTDSLAEGLNLHQHCFHLIHLDLPYNPNRLEQRNGRIDRYGQQREPEIRYLYIPGTFEENLLLHLIGKYEKARSSLDVMPDTLGVTALPGDYEAGLTGGLSEDPYDLFKADSDTIRTLDRAAGDSSPDTVANLMREIDRAFDAFDLMAVCHGWHGVQGSNAEMGQLRYDREPAEDLADFVAAVAAEETGEAPTTHHEIRLPANWAYGLDGTPGFDSARCVLRFTRHFETFRDKTGRDVAYLGRAHPVVLRAIRDCCRSPAPISVGRADHLGLLLTFEIQIPVADRTVFRQVIGILATPDRQPVELDHWPGLDISELADPEDQIWDRLFACWSGPARSKSEDLLSGIASRKQETFVAHYEELRQQQIARSRRWLRVRANHLCGLFTPMTGDLFGASDTEPAWRHQRDPLTRLISYATSPETPVGKRREANDVLEAFRGMEPSAAKPSTVVSRPLGMLMLVPGNVV